MRHTAAMMQLVRTRIVPMLWRWVTTPRGLLRLMGLIVLAIVIAETVRVVAGPNTHAVIPGRIYRCSQPSGPGLARLLKQYEIRTVVNLRGYCPLPKDTWYATEVETTAAVGVSQEDITLSALALPYPDELNRLIEVLDHSPPPILIHCKQGADRTGVASAIVLLLYTDATLAQARRQLWPRYGHVAIGRVRAMDEFLDQYEAWLADRPHERALFRLWVQQHYTPGPARGALQPVNSGEPQGQSQEWLSIPVTIQNQSGIPWTLRRGTYAGIHVSFTVQNAAHEVVARGHAGLMDATVAPGETLPLILAVPPLGTPGSYLLRADLVDARGAGVPVRTTSFHKYGAEPLLLTLRLR
ncbi:MAG: tyrosine-protein phosphatase [Gemmataceae bacterium]